MIVYLLLFMTLSFFACEPVDPLQDSKSLLSLVAVSGSDLSVANAARVSYGRHNEVPSESDANLINTLLANHHETPFEQTFLQFHVKAPLFVARQWMRHRVGVSYNEKSARYTHMDTEFYTPEWRTKDEIAPDIIREINNQYIARLVECSSTYEHLLQAGVKRELARCVLPVSLYTQFVFGCNMRSLLHFSQLRASPDAQWEIQQYAKAMIKMASVNFPTTISTWCRLNNISWLNA